MKGEVESLNYQQRTDTHESIMAINLLPKKEFEIAKRQKLTKSLTLFSAIALFLAAVLAVGSFTFWLTSVNKSKALGERIRILEEEIAQESQTEGYLLSLKKKVSGVKEVVGKRRNFVLNLAALKSVVPVGALISSLTIDQEGVVNISGKADSSQILGSFLDAMLDPENGGQYFSTINLSSIASETGGKYIFSMTARAIFR